MLEVAMIVGLMIAFSSAACCDCIYGDACRSCGVAAFPIAILASVTVGLVLRLGDAPQAHERSH